MEYRYYQCLQYNNKGDYCSHRYIKLRLGIKFNNYFTKEEISDYINKYEIVTECTNKEYYKQPRFYQH